MKVIYIRSVEMTSNSNFALKISYNRCKKFLFVEMETRIDNRGREATDLLSTIISHLAVSAGAV